jgi:hypothetical protein
VNAVAKPANKEISLEALERRKTEIDKYLVPGPRSSHRLSLSHAGSFTTQADDTSTAPTPREQSFVATPRQQSASGTHNIFQDSPTASEASNSQLAHHQQHMSPRAGHMHGGFAFSDKPILGGPEDLARSRSFSGQDRKQMPTSLNVSTGRNDDSQAMRRWVRMLLTQPADSNNIVFNIGQIIINFQFFA